VSTEVRTEAGLSDERRLLEEERAFLLASVRDLDEERDAGDITARDYRVLRDRYTVRAAVVLRALRSIDSAGDSATVAVVEPPPDDHSPDDHSPDVPSSDDSSTVDSDERVSGHPGRRRRVLLVGAVVAVFVGAALAVVGATTGTRLPGDVGSGSARLAPAAAVRRDVAQAATLEQQGRSADALALYRQVLREDPNQVQALTESGWLEFQAGVQAKDAAVVADGQRLEQSAVRAGSGGYPPHLYLGTMLLVEGDAADAVGQFRAYLADDPPPASLAAAAPFVDRAYRADGLTPPELPTG
jgi:tetratricopeptide (TPR) repeat protein